MERSLLYEKEVLLDNYSADALFVLAKGLSLEELFAAHLRLYSTPAALVLVLNTTQADELFFMERLAALPDVAAPPTLISGDVAAADRTRLYLKGGVHFASTRVLIVDIITEKLPLHLVSGILVYRAHKVLNSLQESFILRLFREKKADGFVKAFTDSPTLIGDGNIGQLQRLVKALYLRRVVLLPRFHAHVKEQLSGDAAPELVELSVELSPPMRAIQRALVELIGTCLRELRTCNPGLADLAEEEEAAGVSLSLSLYDSLLERRLSQADPAALTEKTRKILTDVKFLRFLLKQMEEMDPVTFHNSLELLQSNEKEFATNSGWLFTSAASTMFASSRERVNPAAGEGAVGLPVEQPPKWAALGAALEEIRGCQGQLRAQAARLGEETPGGTVLLLSESRDAAAQLSRLLKLGHAQLLRRLAQCKEDSDRPIWDPQQVFLSWEKSADADSEADRQASIDKIKAEQRTRLKESKAKRAAKSRPKKVTLKNQPTMDSFIGDNGLMLDNNAKVRSPKKSEFFEPKSSAADEESRESTDSGVAQSSSAEAGDGLLVIDFIENQRYRLIRTLEALEPSFVILLHTDILAIRTIELFKARRPEHFLRLYVLQYKESGEEARYLHALSRERRAFEFLMGEKATLLVPRLYDTARDPPARPKDQRRAPRPKDDDDDQNEPTRSRVIVDMREFRSELPLCLYKRGLDVVPVTLEVGDYVLSPSTVVERKSYADLAGSLQSGRLYTQTQQMLRHYESVVLLVEGSGEKVACRKRHWDQSGAFGGDMGPGPREIRAKLALLTRAFPDLRIMWSPSPAATVDLFEELKWGSEEPDAEAAAAKKADEEAEGSGNVVLHRMLEALPGVGHAGLHDVLRAATSFQDLCRLAKGGQNGRWDSTIAFLNKDLR